VSNSDAHSGKSRTRGLYILRNWRGMRASLRRVEVLSENAARPIEFFREEGKYYCDGQPELRCVHAAEEAKDCGMVLPVAGRSYAGGIDTD
jgi:hypothetical protein